MNGKSSAIPQFEENQIQEETNQKKTFVQDIFNINYVNTSKIYYQPTAHSSDVKVNNYLCYQQGQNLFKVTEIIYEDKLIRIQDKFEVNIDPDKMKSTPTITCTKRQKACPKNIEKVRIFSKDSRKNGKIEKKDKKNIVKNIVKIFISWLQKKQNDKQNQVWQTALSELKKMLELQNFNNRLIKNIVADDKTNKAFFAFLTDDAEDQIKYSRIQDKESHYQAIQLYVSLLSQTKSRCSRNLKFGSEDFSGSGGSMEDAEFSQNQGGSLLDGSRQQSKSENNRMLSYESRRIQTRNSSTHNPSQPNHSQINGHPSSNHSSNHSSNKMSNSTGNSGKNSYMTSLNNNGNSISIPNILLASPELRESNGKKQSYQIFQPFGNADDGDQGVVKGSE